MLEVIAAVLKVLDKALDRLPAEKQCEVCRQLELAIAERRIDAKAQARLNARRGKLR